MELVRYNKKVTSSRRGEAVIHVSSSNGVIHFSQEALEMLSLKTGDKVEFAHDKLSKKDWFFFKHNHPEAFELREKKGAPGLNIQSSVTAKAMLEGIGIDVKSCGFKFSKNPQIIGDFSCYMIINGSAFGKKLNKS